MRPVPRNRAVEPWLGSLKPVCVIDPEEEHAVVVIDGLRISAAADLVIDGSPLGVEVRDMPS